MRRLVGAVSPSCLAAARVHPSGSSGPEPARRTRSLIQSTADALFPDRREAAQGIHLAPLAQLRRRPAPHVCLTPFPWTIDLSHGVQRGVGVLPPDDLDVALRDLPSEHLIRNTKVE